MPIELKGSCHCGAVKFSLESSTAVPYQVGSDSAHPVVATLISGSISCSFVAVPSVARLLGLEEPSTWVVTRAP